MKVYVDELPKSCGDCVFCKQTEYRYYCDKLHTKLGYIDKDKDCPLQPISDYTKQVRKELCEEIRNWGDKNFNWVGDGTGYDGQDYNEMIGSNNIINKLRELLDQIEKGEI